MEKRGPPLEPPCTAHVVCSITGVSSTCTTADRMPEVTEGPQAWPKTPKPTTVTASPAGERRRVKLGSPPCLTGLQHPNPSLPFTNSNPSLPLSYCSDAFASTRTFPGSPLSSQPWICSSTSQHQAVLQPSFPCWTGGLFRIPSI